MKKKIVALLVMLAAVCWAASALAISVAAPEKVDMSMVGRWTCDYEADYNTYYIDRSDFSDKFFMSMGNMGDGNVLLVYDRQGQLESYEYAAYVNDLKDAIFITYDREGAISQVEHYADLDEYSGTWKSTYYWDPDSNLWHNGKIPVKLPAFNEADYPAIDLILVDANATVTAPPESEPEVPAPEETESPEPAPTPEPVSQSTWYDNNTVGVLGLSLRDDLGLTDKWYNIVPVDLTVPGRQVVRLVASNMYYFGAATIDVADDTVTVNYQLPNGHAYLKDECLQWFASLDQITDSFLNDPVGEYAFGEPVSISGELNGQDVALLFICNRVTYRQPITDEGGTLTRYYRGRDEWVAWREQLMALLERME